MANVEFVFSFDKHYHKCECGLVFKYVQDWMVHVAWCPDAELDCPPLEQVQDCPSFNAIATPHDMNRIEALEFAARLSITNQKLLDHCKPYGNVHEQIREVR